MSTAVLVTGGAGYVGSHTCKALARAGFLPVAYDSLARGHEWAVKWGPLEVGDIHDRERLGAVVDRYAPGAVLHFAALAYVGESCQDPAAYYHNNVAGTLALLEVMRARGLRHMVFSSTCATYGIPDRLPIDEAQPQRPINPYGATKLAVERMLRDFEGAYAMRSVCLRYFNAAGADPDGELGEVHEPETHLVPLAIETALGRRPALPVFGNDYPTPDGTAIRDYVNVVDLADAHVAALGHLEGGGESCALNLGTGRGHSVADVVTAVEKAHGAPLATAAHPRRPGDPPELVADARRAREILGWRARCSGLDEIVGSALRWHRGLGPGGIPAGNAS